MSGSLMTDRCSCILPCSIDVYDTCSAPSARWAPLAARLLEATSSRHISHALQSSSARSSGDGTPRASAPRLKCWSPAMATTRWEQNTSTRGLEHAFRHAVQGVDRAPTEVLTSHCTDVLELLCHMRIKDDLLDSFDATLSSAVSTSLTGWEQMSCALQNLRRFLSLSSAASFRAHSSPPRLSISGSLQELSTASCARARFSQTTPSPPWCPPPRPNVHTSCSVAWTKPLPNRAWLGAAFGKAKHLMIHSLPLLQTEHHTC